ncbi:MAG: restriction endonuclease subunit S [Aureispira sp.]
MNNNFLDIKISELGRVLTGNTPPTSNRNLYEGKYPLIMPTDIVEGAKYIGKTAETISDEGFNKYEKSLIPANTTCVVTIGTIGKKICLSKEPSFTNQAINAIIVNVIKYDPIYVFYLLKYNLPQVKNLSSGTASGRENVNKSAFSGIKVKVPNLPTQKKIANILSAYDDLIENNNQRIQLLEEMAAEIYKEWFVRLRFPDYQSATFVDKEGKEVPVGTEGALPLGWEKVRIGDVFNTSSGGTPSRKREEYYLDGTINWVKTKELLGKFIFSTEEKITEEALKKSSTKIFESNTILMGMYGATLGRLGVLAERSATNQACCAFLPINHLNYSCAYLFQFLKSKYKIFFNLSAGSAQQNLSQETIKKIIYLKPSQKILKEFDEIETPLFDEIKILMLKNETLQQTRDLLLPRLISGKLSVENIDLTTLSKQEPIAN